MTVGSPCTIMSKSNLITKPAKVSFSSKELWEEALHRLQSSDETAKKWDHYVALLNKKDIAAAPSAQDAKSIQDIAIQTRDECEKPKIAFSLRGRQISLQKVLDKTIDALLTFKDIGGTLASLNPYASLAWGGIQFFVNVASTSTQVRRLCHDNLPRILELTAQYVTFEFVYEGLEAEKSGSLVREAVLKLYVAILRYHVSLVTFANSKTERFMAAFTRVTESEISTILGELKELEEHLQIVLRHAQFESTSKWMKDLSSAVRELRGISDHTTFELEHVAQAIKRERQTSILQWISPVLYENYHNNQAKTNMEGTAGWLLEHEHYNTWKQDPESSLFWLRGHMGSGKSCLSHAVINDTKAMQQTIDGSFLAYMYCDRTTLTTQQDISSAERVLRCLVKQLAQPQKGHWLMNDIIEIHDRLITKAELTAEDCVDLIQRLADQSTVTTIIIDGLDECPLQPDVQGHLVDHLLKVMKKCSKPVHVFISSRPEQQIYERLRDVASYNISTEGSNLDDILYFIRTRVETSAADRYKRIYSDNNPEEREAVIEVLHRNAKGMFRWADLALEYLHRSRIASRLKSKRKSLIRLNSLDKMYRRMYQDIKEGPDGDEDFGALVDAVLLMVMYSRVGDLWEWAPRFFELDSDSDEDADDTDYAGAGSCNEVRKPQKVKQVIPWLLQFHPSGLPDTPLESDDDLLALCPGLLSRDAAGNLTIPHASVVQYFEDNHPTTFSHKAGHALLASTCIRRLEAYRSYPLSHHDAVDVYCASYWSSHILEVGLDGHADDFLSLSGTSTQFSDIIDQFLLSKRSNDVISQARRVLSACLDDHKLEHHAQTWSIVDFRQCELNYRTSLMFSPGSEFGTLPVRIALNYKLSDVAFEAYDKALVPYEYRDLSITGFAALVSSHDFFESMLTRNAGSGAIDLEEILLSRSARYSDRFEQDGALMRRLQERASDQAILALLEKHGFTPGTKCWEADHDEHPWTLLRGVLASGMTNEAKGTFLQRLPKDCLRKPSFETLRYDLFDANVPVELLRPFIGEIRDDMLLLSELTAGILNQWSGRSRFTNVQPVLVPDIINYLLDLNAPPRLSAEYDYYIISDLSETLLGKDMPEKFGEWQVFVFDYVARKFDDDSEWAWSPLWVIMLLKSVLEGLGKLYALDLTNPIYRDIKRAQNDSRQIQEEIALVYNTDFPSVRWYDAFRRELHPNTVPTKVSSVRDWKPYLDEVSRILHAKIATEQLVT